MFLPTALKKKNKELNMRCQSNPSSFYKHINLNIHSKLAILAPTVTEKKSNVCLRTDAITINHLQTVFFSVVEKQYASVNITFII